MLQPHEAIYIGKDFDEGYLGYFCTAHIFLILSIEEGVSKEEGEEILKEIKTHITHLRIFSLAKFESKISELVLQLNLPAGSSLAAGMMHDDVLYVKTIGKGQIYMRRGKELIKLIHGNNSASGYLKQFDCIIFTTALINGLLGTIEDIKTFVDLNSPEDIADDLTSQNYGEEDTGIIALFVEFEKPAKKETIEDTQEQLDVMAEEEIISTKEIRASQTTIPDNIDMDAVYDQDVDEIDHMEDEELEKHIRSDYKAPKENIFATKMEDWKDKMSKMKTPTINKSKKLTMAIVGVIFVILVWSVVFGYQRRSEAERSKKVQTTRESVQKKVTEAEDVAFLNLDRAMGLLSEAKIEVETLKKDLGDKKVGDVQEIEQLIKEKENQIVKKEEKTYTEFYDLALENKDASGETMYLDGENVAILDSKKGTVYMLSLAKKSIEKKTATDVSSGRLVGMYKDRVYVLGGNGIIQFTGTDKDKAKKVLEYDSEWGSIKGLFTYNGNIYLLDQGKSDVYKYIATESGFSKKSSYFSGDSPQLDSATSIAIDSSLYISNGSQILKYTRGVAEEFKTAFPTSDVKITKVYTDQEIEKVYAWDKTKGVVYVVNKTGNYERQFKSDILKKANDFFATKDGVYILSGQKIYKMSL